MDNLRTAIISHFDQTTALTSIFAEGLHFNLGPNDKAMPVISASLKNDDNSYELGGRTYEATYSLTFNLWTLTDTEGLAAIRAIETAFDFCTLSLTAPDVFLLITRKNEDLDMEDENTWRGIVVYEINIERTY